MIKRNLYGLIISVIFLVAVPALAEACSAKARAIAGQNPNATLISVDTAVSNGAQVCVIKLKIKSTNGQPERIVTRTVKK